MKPVDLRIGTSALWELDIANERRLTFNPPLTEAEFAGFCAANHGLRIVRDPSGVIIVRRKRKGRDDYSDWLLSQRGTVSSQIDLDDAETPSVAFDFPLREERMAEKVARTVTQQRRKPLRAPGTVDVSALLIAERNERDNELVEQIARSVAWRRRSMAYVEDDLGAARDAKRARIAVTLENDLIRNAQAFTGIKEKSALIRIALTQLVEREAAKKRAAQGGTIPRRRLPGK